MNATLEDTLLDLFHQVIEDPDRIPVVPTDAWPEDSEQGRLLTSLHDMLTLIQQSKQQAERQLREKEELRPLTGRGRPCRKERCHL